MTLFKTFSTGDRSPVPQESNNPSFVILGHKAWAKHSWIRLLGFVPSL
jgi:hypothetical protein